MAAITEKQEELIVCHQGSILISKQVDIFFQPLAVKGHQAAINLGQEAENGQLEGMALIKSTCQRMLISVILSSPLSCCLAYL